MTLLRACIVLLLLVCFGAGCSPGVLGFVPGVGDASDVIVDDGTALVVSGQFGVSVADVGQPTNPEVIGAATQPFPGGRAAVAGDRMVVVGEGLAGGARLWVLDRSDASAPVLVGTLAGSDLVTPVTGFLDVALSPDGATAVVARGTAGVASIDLSNPEEPQILDTLDTPGTAHAVAMSDSGSHVHVADGSGGLRILSLAASGALQETGSVLLSSWVLRDVALAGDLAYLANQQGGFYVVNAANPSNPVLVGATGTSGLGLHVAVDGAVAVVLGSTSTVTVLDVFLLTDPIRPSLSGSQTVATVGNARGVALEDSVAYVAAGEEGLKIYSVGTQAPALQSIAADTFEAGATDSAGGLSVVVGEDVPTQTGRLRVVDTSAIVRPELAAELAIPDLMTSSTGFQDVVMHPTGTYAVASRGLAGFSVVDLANPAQPSITATVGTGGASYGMAFDAAGIKLFVADGPGGLKVYDMSSPNQPALLGTKNLTGVMRGVAIAGDVAFVANQMGGLKVVDVSDPSSMVQISGKSTSGFAFHVATDGTVVTLLTDDGNNTILDVFDASDPRRPAKVGSLPVAGPGNANGIAMGLGFAVVATGQAGLGVYSLADPANPTLHVSMPVVGEARDVALTGSMAAVADTSATISILTYF